jgi:uncharacterized protein (DUF302 family)
MDFELTVRVPDSFAPTVDRVRAALKEQGFGVLTEIDVRATLQEKLGEQVEDYLILGACNPPLAHRALEVDRRIGVLLPCNVVVRSAGDHTVVEALAPRIMVTVTGRPDLAPVADEAQRRIEAALDSLRG